MHTVEEAKTKWCPQVRYYTVTSGCRYNNRSEVINNQNNGQNCIADECMWWVWEGDGNILSYTEPEDKTGWVYHAGNIVQYWLKTVDKTGRCGRVTV